MRRDWIKLLAVLLPVLTGCLSHTRKLQQPVLAGPVMDADVLDLVKGVNERYDKIQSLTATMDFNVSVGGVHKGKQTDYTSLRGFMLFRKPQMLRVLIKVPVILTTAVDLASDGTDFKLLIPSKSRVIEGKNSVGKRSPTPLENLRPSVFVDSVLIHDISPDQIVSVIHESSTTLDVKTKRLIELPQYDLTVMSGAPPVSDKDIAKVAEPLRVIRFSRVDLLPVEQDIYNSEGDLETQVLYGPYKDFDGTKFPVTIDISRPLDEYRIRLSVEKLLVNQPLPDKQFELTIPAGTKVQTIPER
jgi:outer membrane lipoprotein-sorting protein